MKRKVKLARQKFLLKKRWQLLRKVESRRASLRKLLRKKSSNVHPHFSVISARTQYVSKSSLYVFMEKLPEWYLVKFNLIKKVIFL